MRILLTSLLALSPALAFAQGACPTGADLSRGIEFKIGDGATEVYKDNGNGIVQVDFRAPDGFESRVLLGKGIYLLESSEVSNGSIVPSSRITYSHALQPADMPIPRPMGRWVSEAATMADNRPGREVHNHAFGPATTLTIGACSYDMIPITLHYGDPDGTIDHLEYLPDLGLAMLVGSSYTDADGMRQDDVYSYISLEAMGGGRPPSGGSSGSGKKGKN